MVGCIARARTQVGQHDFDGFLIADFKDLVERTVAVDIVLACVRIKILQPTLVGILDIEVEQNRGHAVLPIPRHQREAQIRFPDAALAALGKDNARTFRQGCRGNLFGAHHH